MPRYRITAPVPGYTGNAAGVIFAAGVAEVEVPDDPADPYARAVAYMRHAGYRVEELLPDPPAPPAAKPKPKPSAAASTSPSTMALCRPAPWAALSTSRVISQGLSTPRHKVDR